MRSNLGAVDWVALIGAKDAAAAAEGLAEARLGLGRKVVLGIDTPNM